MPLTPPITQAQLDAEINASIPDNTVNAVTPADVRNTMLDMAAATFNPGGSLIVGPLTDPTTTANDPVFSPGNPVLNLVGFNVTTTFTSVSVHVGHALEGYAVGTTTAPTSGSLVGVSGGSLQEKAGFDAFGILGEISASPGVSAAGVGVAGLIRGSALGTPVAMEAISEADYGYAQEGFKVAALYGVAFGTGVYVQGANTYGFLVGGDGIGPVPVYPFAFYIPSRTPQLAISNIANDASGTVTLYGAHGFITGNSVTLYGIYGSAGMLALNGTTHSITTTGPTSFTIGVNTTSLGAYVSNGVVVLAGGPPSVSLGFAVDSEANILGASTTVTPVHYAALPTPALGMIACVDNSSVNTWGGIANGSGANKVMVWYDGTNWSVMGKVGA